MNEPCGKSASDPRDPPHPQERAPQDTALVAILLGSLLGGVGQITAQQHIPHAP
ncbi:hypothetical protein [Rhodospirillum sp. A1_3_36]|uniref:hypothetical protein n=1 Tax=Rhodospirillum sp. A1_3_36 TaxID=3391666 RepID=UPI0039A441EE